jgi:hypothetical protein
MKWGEERSPDLGFSDLQKLSFGFSYGLHYQNGIFSCRLAIQKLDIEERIL